MKKSILFEELLIFLRGRFSLTDEEKTWLLFVLFIVWVGLVGKHFRQKSQEPESISVEELLINSPHEKR